MSEFEVGPARDEEEALRYFEIAARALLVPQAGAAGWMEREGWQTARVARSGGALLGGMTVQRVGQWFGGRRVPCGVVRAVGVAPEARAAGVASTFLKYGLEELRADRIPLSMLFPATQKVYRRAGFEQAGHWIQWEGNTDDLVDDERSLPVTSVDPEHPSIREVFAAFCAQSNGLLDRNEWLWERTLRPAFGVKPEDLSALLLGPEEAPEGYLLLHTEQGATPYSKGTVVVRDRALLTERAVRRARALIAGHRSMTERVLICGGVVEPLLAVGPNQRYGVHRSESWMLRLTDPAAALRARGYAPTASGELHLEVIDDVLAPHEQRLVLRVRDGQAEVEAGGRGDVRVDVRALAAIYAGFWSPLQARVCGGLRGDGAAALVGLFAGEPAWTNEIV